MGDNSCLKGCGFESWRCILDGHFFTLICCKNCIACLKRLKINEKEAGLGPFFKKELNWSSALALLYDDVSSNHPDLEIFLQQGPLLTDAMND